MLIKLMKTVARKNKTFIIIIIKIKIGFKHCRFHIFTSLNTVKYIPNDQTIAWNNGHIY